jgi:hypothetical protein
VHCCETRRTFPDERIPADPPDGGPPGERRRLQDDRVRCPPVVTDAVIEP